MPRLPLQALMPVVLYLFPILVLAPVPLQTFLDFNAIYILIEIE